MHRNARRALVPGLVLLVPGLIASLAWPAPAAAESWSPIGPYGGSITALAVAPGARRTLYSGTSEGLVFRSLDAGARWTLAGADFPFGPITKLKVDPRDAATVYATVCESSYEFGYEEGGLFKSTDGGSTWAAVSELPECHIFDLAFDPRQPSRIFAATAKGLFQSEDDGASWDMNPGVPVGQAGVAAVAFEPASPGTIYALHSGGVLKSVDGGATWTLKNSGLPAEFSRLWKLAIDPRTPGTLYVARSSLPGEEDTVYRSTDGAATWSPTAAELQEQQIFDLAVHPATSILYAATKAGVFRSGDGGRTWTAPAAGTPARLVRALAVPSGPAEVVYAGVELDGVFKSTDRGASWRTVNRGLHGLRMDSLLVARTNPSILYTGVSGWRSLRSQNGGATWTRVGAASMNGAKVDPWVIAIDPSDARTVYAISAGNVLWRSTNGGVSWRSIADEDMACTRIGSFVIDPVEPDNLFVGGYQSQCPERRDVCLGFHSADAGESWSCLKKAPESGLLALAIDPVRPSTLYSVGLYGDVVKTTNRGKSWTAIGSKLPTYGGGSSLAATPSALYVSLPDGIFKSRDGAVTWTPANRGLGHLTFGIAATPANPSILYTLSLTFDPSSEDPLYGVYRTTDAAGSWHLLTKEGLPPGPLGVVVAHPRLPRQVFVLTPAGIYQLK